MTYFSRVNKIIPLVISQDELWEIFETLGKKYNKKPELIKEIITEMFQGLKTELTKGTSPKILLNGFGSFITSKKKVTVYRTRANIKINKYKANPELAKELNINIENLERDLTTFQNLEKNLEQFPVSTRRKKTIKFEGNIKKTILR